MLWMTGILNEPKNVGMAIVFDKMTIFLPSPWGLYKPGCDFELFKIICGRSLAAVSDETHHHIDIVHFYCVAYVDDSSSQQLPLSSRISFLLHYPVCQTVTTR